MQIGNKRTTLKDNAAIYNHVTDGMTNKEKFKSLKGKDKWIFFRDYYLLKIAATVLISVFVISLVITMLRPRKEVLLYTIISDGTMRNDVMTEIQAAFDLAEGIDPETQETQFDDSFYLTRGDYNQEQRFAILLYAGEISVAILPEQKFLDYAQTGRVFLPLSEVLPPETYDALSDRFVMTGINDDDGIYIPDSEKAYGLCLDGSKYYTDFTYSEPVVLAVSASCPNMDVCVDFIEFLLK